MPDNRRDVTTLAVFAIATILDDVRFLQWAADRVDLIAEEFAAVLGNSHDETQATADDDVGQKWKHTCDAIAATATPPRWGSSTTATLEGFAAAYARPWTTFMNLWSKFSKQLIRRNFFRVSASQWRRLWSKRRSCNPLLRCTRSGVSRTRLASNWTSSRYPRTWTASHANCQKHSKIGTRRGLARRILTNNWRMSNGNCGRSRGKMQVLPQVTWTSSALRIAKASSMTNFVLASGEIRDARNHIWAVVAPKEEKFDPGKDYRAALAKGGSACRHSL